MLKQSDDNVLCSAGKLLEARLIPCTKNLEKACLSLQNTCTQISESIKSLTEYAVRDKERLDSLEKSRDCKSKKLNENAKETQDLKVEFATHLGEHEATKKIEGATGRRWGTSSAFGGIAILEFLRYLFTGKWG